MKKILKRIFLLILLVLILAPLLGYLALKTDWGRNYATELISRTLTKELGVPVSIGNIDFDPIQTIELKDVLVLDQESDTLLAAQKLFADISLLSLGQKKIHLNEILLSSAYLSLKTHRGEEDMNLVKLINDLTADISDKQKWDFQVESVVMEDMTIEHWNENKDLLDKRRLDPAHLYLTEVNGELFDIEFIEGGVVLKTQDLTAIDHSGLALKQLDSRLKVDKTTLSIKDMTMRTSASDVFGRIVVDYSSEERKELYLEADLDESLIKISELGYFVNGYEDLDGEVGIDASLKGRLSDLFLTDAELRFGNSSDIKFDGATIKGLPDIDALWLDVDIHPLNSSIADLQYLPVPGMKDQVNKLPPEVYRLGRIAFNGHFTGFLEDFNATGELNTDLGRASAAMAVYIADDSDLNRYQGRLDLNKLALGSLLNDPQIGKISSDLDIDMSGYGRGLSAELKGKVESFQYRSYTYKNLTVDGTLEERLFNGFLSIRQPEIDLDFKGLVDLRTETPQFNFKAEVFQADIGGLGFAAELDSTSMTCIIEADFKGGDIDEFEGQVSIDALSFCRDDEKYFFDDMDLVSKLQNEGKTILFRSEMMDARITGQFLYTDLKDDFLALFDEVLPALYSQEKQLEPSGTKLDFEVDLKRTDDISRLLVSGLEIGAGTRIIGTMDADIGKFEMQLSADSLDYNFIALQGVFLDIFKDGDVAYTSLETNSMQWSDSLRFEDNFYTFNAYRDSVETDFTWSLVDKDASGSISALSIFHSPDSIRNILYPSQLIMSGDYWLTQGFSEFLYANGALTVENAQLSNGKELIAAEGTIGKKREDRLDFEVLNFELEHLNKFLPADMVDLDGMTTLSGFATAVLGKPTVVAEMLINDFEIGAERLGHIDLSSTWNRGKDYLEIEGHLENKGINEVVLDGRYFPNTEGDNLDAELSFEGFHLGVLNKLPTGGINEIGGKATGALEVKGSLLEPDINGELSFENATIRIDYLNTKYYFNDKVIVRNDYIGTNYIPFRDEFGNQGYLNGTVAHENYRDWNYDIFAEFEKMMVLNTDASMNPTFYGKIFGTGSVSIFGYDRNMTLEIFGKTEEGTVVDLPLGNSEEVVLEDFIYFKSKEENTKEIEDDRPPTTIELYMEAQATPDAQIRLVFDEKIGDVMQGSGTGTLTMTLDRAGAFEIFGNYMIAQGDYLFTLQNVVNKRFNVLPGSTVSFFGDPYEAELDLVTEYSLRASLSNVLASDGLSYSNRVPVKCQMDLDGRLFNPSIDFNIEFPGLEPSLESLAQSKLDTDEELNRQVFSLLVLNKFLPSESTDASAGISAATATINEFASSQLSNWLSQISDDVDVGVNYRSGDNITSEELAVALTTQLFNDRLLLTGNFGVQSAPSNTVEGASSVIGDFRLEYILTKDGRLRLKVFNETNDYSFLNGDQAATKQGVGLVFQREFDGLFDDSWKK